MRTSPHQTRYAWAAVGDINAFFGLVLDNVADLVLLVTLLAAEGLPADFTLRYMVPGTAIGVLFGDLVYTWMAFRLARSTGSATVTAMPLGLDTPSTFGMVLFVLGPAFREATARGLDTTAAAHYTWQIGMCALLASGVFKLVCALVAGWVRRTVPRAGLLGSLAAIALVLISFLPLIDILHNPIVGLVALTVILTTLVARLELPLRVPGALAAVLAGTAIHYLLRWSTGESGVAALDHMVWLPIQWTEAWSGHWLATFGESLKYLPFVIPFALATVIGGIDCTESAAAAGDEYDTRTVILVEGLATLVAAFCGGVVQTTPYIGHPAYKQMGGRAAYTLATALFIGSAGVVGYFAGLYALLPMAAVFPILIFVGLEITAQSFAATPQKHYPAVALACVPALAYLVLSFVDPLLGETHASLKSLSHFQAERLATLRLLANGFIITGLLWASMLAALIDRRLLTAAVLLVVCGAACFVGVIHSPLPGAPIGWPWQLARGSAFGPSPYVLSAAYGACAVLLLAWHAWRQRSPLPEGGL